MQKSIAELDQAYANEAAQIGHKIYNRRILDGELTAHFAKCDQLAKEKKDFFEAEKLEREAKKVADALIVEGAKNG
jgi:hypothetical protein